MQTTSNALTPKVREVTLTTKASLEDRIHFAIIRFVHETVYGILVDPNRRLIEAGLENGQRVLEVGCGPGFFTTPAAKIVDKTGYVYAVDINPAAVEHVRRKVEQEGLRNVRVELADAAETGLASESIDMVFLFGVMLSFSDVSKVMREMHRVLRKNGILSVKSGMAKKELLKTVCADKKFRFIEKRQRTFVFASNGN